MHNTEKSRFELLYTVYKWPVTVKIKYRRWIKFTVKTDCEK